jgi:hypothetical protein
MSPLSALDLVLLALRLLNDKALHLSAKFPYYSFSLVFASIIVFFAIGNYIQFLPWQVSWFIQKEVRESLRINRKVLENAKFVLLAGCPRYSCSAPVADGVWDFGGMVQVVLGRKSVKGTVVSDRLHVSGGRVKDVSSGFVCADTDFDQLYLITPQRECKSIQTAEELQEAVAATNKSFQPSLNTIKSWRK